MLMLALSVVRYISVYDRFIEAGRSAVRARCLAHTHMLQGTHMRSMPNGHTGASYTNRHCSPCRNACARVPVDGCSLVDKLLSYPQLFTIWSAPSIGLFGTATTCIGGT